MTELYVAGSCFSCCCFFPDGRLIAGATYSTIYLWDISGSDPHLIETFIGHTQNITSLTFSSSLISASEDQSVRFWMIGALSADKGTTDIIPTPVTLAPIKSVTLQVRDGIAISCDKAGVVKTWDITTGLCKASFQTPAQKDYSLGDAQVIEGRLIFVWYVSVETHIWGAKKDGLQVVGMPGANDLRISGDGSKIFILTDDSIQA